MSLFTENIIPGNHGKIFSTNANTAEDLEQIKEEILKIDGVVNVLLNAEVYPKEFTIHTSTIIEVDAIEEKVRNTGFNAIPKSLFQL